MSTTRKALTLDVPDDTNNKVITVVLIVVISVIGASICLAIAIFCIVKREKRRRKRKRKRARRTPKMMRTPPYPGQQGGAPNTASTMTQVGDPQGKRDSAAKMRRKKTTLGKLLVFMMDESTSDSENYSKHSEVTSKRPVTIKTEKEPIIMDIAPPPSAEHVLPGDKRGSNGEKERIARTPTPQATPKLRGTPAKSPLIEETDATITPALEVSKTKEKRNQPESGKSFKSTPAPSAGPATSTLQQQNVTTPSQEVQPESLKSTQSITNLSRTKTSMSCKPRKHPRRDERFPKLTPGTVEYMAALCGEPPTRRDRYSGTMDGSDIADLVNV